MYILVQQHAPTYMSCCIQQTRTINLVHYCVIVLTIYVKSSDGNIISLSFMSLLGIRQGDNLSPTLFNNFNDIPNIFNHSCDIARLGNIPISCMMYADDLILLSETNQGLQESMDKLSHYCTQWGLTVNINKTTCMVTKSNISLVSKLTN